MLSRTNLAYMAVGASMAVIVIFFIAGSFMAGLRIGRSQTETIIQYEPSPGSSSSVPSTPGSTPSVLQPAPVLTESDFSLNGQIVSMASNSFVVRTTDGGDRTVLITSATIIRTKERRVEQNALGVGMSVFVVGRTSGGVFRATLIRFES